MTAHAPFHKYGYLIQDVYLCSPLKAMVKQPRFSVQDAHS